MIEHKTHVAWSGAAMTAEQRDIWLVNKKNLISYCGAVLPRFRFVDVDRATCGSCKRLVAKDIAYDIEDALG